MPIQKKTSIIVGLAVAFVVFALSFIFLDRWLALSFFQMEQSQIFLFDWKDILSKLLSPCGVSLVISQFLVQFFKIPHVGALTTALLGLGCLLFIWGTLKKKGAPLAALPLCLVPIFLQEGALSDTFYSYHGFVSFFIAALFLWIYARFISDLKVLARTALEVLLVIILYLAVGPVALLLAVCMAILDLFSKGKAWAAIPIITVLLCGWVSVRSGFVQNMQLAILQHGYYEPLAETYWYIHASWIVLALVIAAGTGCSFLKGRIAKAVLATFGAVVALVLFFNIPDHINRKYYDALRLIHYINEENWDAILSDPTAKHNNFIMMSVRNLALSHKGLLLDNLFDYPQQGWQSLLVDDEQSTSNPGITFFDSHIYYQMGCIGASMNKAFDSNVGVKYGNPSMAMKLIRTNLLWGAWEVAEKNIAIMEKTWGYREEAHGLRRFLRDEDAMMSDPELGRLRLSLPQVDRFAGLDVVGDLKATLQANPKDKSAREYYVAFMLLAKDIEGLRRYIENDPGAYGPDGSLHPLLQEVIMIYSEGDKDYCREHGVTDETFKRYDSFKKQYLRAGNNGGNPLRDMKSYSNSFWYYYLFTKI